MAARVQWLYKRNVERYFLSIHGGGFSVDWFKRRTNLYRLVFVAGPNAVRLEMGNGGAGIRQSPVPKMADAAR
jgi:hypothetical protein